MAEKNECFKPHSEETRRAALERLAANGGNIARTVRETGISNKTLRKWSDRAARDESSRESVARGPEAVARRAGGRGVRTESAHGSQVPRPEPDGDLERFSKDAWEIIHKANEVVKGEVEGMPAKEAASIAAGYFDRQAKAEERLAGDGAAGEEYAAEWGGERK